MKGNEDITDHQSAELSQLRKQVEALSQRCAEAEDALEAIRTGAVDAVVVYTDQGEKVFTIHGAETTYRLMIKSINEGAATLIEDGTILYSNKRFAEMLKTPLQSLIGSSINQYIPLESRLAFSTILSRALKENFREEFDLLRSDGQSIPRCSL